MMAASTHSPAIVRPLSYDLDAGQVMIRSFHRFWPLGSDSRNPVLLAIYAQPLGVLTGTDQVTDKRRTNSDHFVPSDHYMWKQ
jgi:hypothetical protein